MGNSLIDIITKCETSQGPRERLETPLECDSRPAVKCLVSNFNRIPNEKYLLIACKSDTRVVLRVRDEHLYL